MKKYLMILCLLSISYTTQTSQPIDYRKKTPNDMLNILLGAQIRAFVVKDLFAHPLDAEGLKTWYEAINHISQYIDLNSKNLFGVRDKSIIDVFNVLNKINIDLINNIKVAYNSKKNNNTLQYCANVFNRLISETKYVQQFLPLMKIEGTKKQNAQILLSKFAFTLQVTAEAAFKHIQKYIAL